MKIWMLLPVLLIAGCAQYSYEASTLVLDNTSILWLGHSSFMIEANGKIIYLDPYVLPTNPKQADIILVTHEHFDHAGEQQINDLRMENTTLFGPTAVVRKTFGNPVSDSANFDSGGFQISTTKAYNINKYDAYGKLYHSEGVGYIIEINGRRIYFAGDTDNIPEMKNLGKIDVAILPIGGRYTMNPEDAVEAAKIIKPEIVVPMHFNSERYGIQGISVNPSELVFKLAGTGIDVRILEPFVK
jgi:L-ascorbate metabolism protein UlaG (beta-lactamase superfamily)